MNYDRIARVKLEKGALFEVESSKPHEEVECLTDPSITTTDAVHDASNANVADEETSRPPPP